ncbi:ABC transporter permease subunit [Amycolatopsis anabasis]|uniref:ABC transporter permease subunit n=1 Tax=Amycolatopsis anabasis TaxID=1840409 RepID=UPI00131C62CF|nr:ABC transporter permease subunit [Amycolatopsis anabasis]
MTQAVLSGAARPAATTVGVSRLIRAELRWIFRRPRTLIVLGLLAVIPVVVGISLTLVDPTSAAERPGGGPNEGLFTAAMGNAFVLPIAVLAFTLQLLLPLTAAMAGADALAGESAHGTLRGWMLAPVSRGRLLAVKAFGVATVALAAAVVMAVTGVLTGLVINGTGSMFTLSGSTLSIWAVLGKVGLAAGWVTLQLWAVGAVALAISACTEHPMLVVVSVLGGTVVFSVLSLLSAVDWLHPFLLNNSWDVLADVLRDPVPAGSLTEGALRAVCYIAIALSLAYARLTTRDG